MKFHLPKATLFLCAILISAISVFGQDANPANQKPAVRTRCTANRAQMLANPVLYILKLNSNPHKEAIPDSLTMTRIKNAWIDKIDVLKDRRNLIQRYGDRAKNGVIMITLQADSFKTSKELRKLRFRKTGHSD